MAAGPPRLSAFFAAALASDRATALALPGGAPLFLAGEPADRLYLLRSGRLRVLRGAPGGQVLVLGEIGAGDPVGEMAALEGGVHGASVIAARDSELVSVSRESFLRAAADDPALIAELATIIVERVRQAALARRPGPPPPASVGFFAVETRAPIRPLIERLAEAIRVLGRTATVLASEWAMAAADEPAPTSADEMSLFVVEQDETSWRRRVARQVDAAFAVIDGGTPVPNGPLVEDLPSEIGLILRWVPTAGRSPGAEDWARRLGSRRILHIEASSTDFARLARTLAGRSVALVLSGGSARGLAHVGVVRALRRRGVPIDEVAGASMGAVIALAIAMGWSQNELEGRIREAFASSSPISDIAFPFLSLSRGGIVRRRLRQHFGDTEIADLARPFFCLSSNLTTGEPVVHDAGLAREAVLASLSIPGVLPPVVAGQDILVDGAVMNNFPADFMRARHAGPIIGVDVGKADGLTAADLMTPAQIVRWLISGAWRRGPPIVSILMRAATVSAGREVIASRAMTDLLIEPKVADIEIRDWRAFDRAAEAGEIAADEALDAGGGALERVWRGEAAA